jgi:hypothetical protein
MKESTKVRLFQFLLIILGGVLLALVDWKLPLAVFLWMWADNLTQAWEYLRNMEIYKELTE